MEVVEMVVSAMFKEVLDKLVSEGVKQFMKLVNKGKNSKNKINIEDWKNELEMIERVLSDAEQKQCDEQHGAAIRLWLENLQDLAFDLEDLLDDFAYQALKMNQGNNDDFDVHHFKKNARGFLPTSFHNMVGSVLACGCSTSRQIGYSGPDFSSRIDEISNALNKIQTRVSTLGLLTNNLRQPTNAVEEQHRKMRETSSLISDKHHVYGRNDTKKDIICQLLEDKLSYENYVVIPIVGMGGIGKTTLAQYVYNDKEVKTHFALKAWVCVSDAFDVKRITNDIINSATQGNFDCSNLNQAQEKLQQVLKDNKFLIVLDDIWSEKYEEWNQLQIPFLGAARGSRVIVTTRKEVTARVMNNPNPIHLEHLSGEYCWSIFQQHVNTMHSDLAERRDDIIRKCDGLPLAAKALGGLLRKTVEKSRRQRIIDSNIWSKTCEILPVLWLSYHHLSSLLKCLFAYCSIFPKDYEFEEMEIIQLWMAQGFLPDTTTNERMEDIGHEYFNDLVSRSLFEKSPSARGMFIMHDLIHDVAQSAAGNLCNVMDGTDTQTDFRRTRHLFITKHVQTLGNQIMASQLRTFLWNYALKIDYSDFFNKIRYIRTLFLYSDEIEALPECIGDLKHLRYLSLKLRRIKELPLSINDLWNLQTLCLKGCGGLEKVLCIESLGKLRHLYAGNNCVGIGKLTNLQTLDILGGSRLRELGKLNQLRGRLRIMFALLNVTEVEVKDAEEAQLCKKEHLDRLELIWRRRWREVVNGNKMQDVVEKLRPHTSIKECELGDYMGSTFPSWLGDSSFINMVDIYVHSCDNCVCLPPLGQLRSLKSFKIVCMDGIKEVGLEFYGKCPIPFPSLKTLEFSCMRSWEKWVHPLVDNKAFPNLEMLSIYDCPSLQGDIPPHLPSLRRLEINEVEQLQSLELKNSSSSTSHLPLTLKSLRIYNCKKLRYVEFDKLSTNSSSSISHLEEVIVMYCKSMVSIGQIPLTLKSLMIDDCEKLRYVEFDEQSTNLSRGSDKLELPLLTELEIVRCPSLISLQQSLLLPALRDLHLKECENMEKLPGEFDKLSTNSSSSISHLENVIVESCDSMVSIGQIPLTLKSLRINDCEKLRYVEFDEQSTNLSRGSDKLELPLLTELEIVRCPSLISLQQSLLLPALQHLHLKECDNITSLVTEKLPGELHNITSLQSLAIEDCPKIHSLAEGGLHFLTSHLSLPSSLSTLHINSFQNLKTVSFNGSTSPNLTRLVVSECPRLESLGLHLLTSLEFLDFYNEELSNSQGLNHWDTLESISYPDFPSSLCELNIGSFQNLKTICCSTLPRLRRMHIFGCHKLESFGDNGLPPHIDNVDIELCEMIEQHLTSDPNGRITNYGRGKFSMPLSGSQPSSAETTC
ncbi:putative disease resistance RPP13-like protein 1 [Chenopodium quinoa]|uniref:putative disease resistance RPP13-like protein 1 n=1 Tax=Chenopodium quinoa TaxID=63459 RepID=UPI000B784AFB|nr:putative disease resistance RPP13-like protein 1 [Chenopodium quinoa]